MTIVENEVPIIDVKNLNVSFFTKLGEVKVLDDVSYKVTKGKVLGVVGESGCGKSVTALTLMGLLPHPGKITGGSIDFQGVNLATMKESVYEDYRGHKLAMIFQEPMTALNPVLTVGTQITEQVIRHQRLSPKRAMEKAIDLLHLVGIPSPAKRAHQYPHQLSGGMKQRAMVAMALSCEPTFLIADEPTTALDVTIQAQILDLIQELMEKFQMTVQFITHDLGVISEISDRVLVMYAGRIVESGPAERIFSRPLHPYTLGLLESRPKFGARVEKLHAIQGEVPSPYQRPRGCSFSNRCSRASERCSVEKPPLVSEGLDHLVACFHPLPA